MRKNARKNAASSADRPAPAPGADAIACPSCGRPIGGEASFCPHCGVNVALYESRSMQKKQSRRKQKKDFERLAGPAYATCTNDLVGFRAMFEDGEAESLDGVFSHSIEFGDISYENERRDVRDAIFDKFAEIHSLFQPGTVYQINLCNFPNRTTKVNRYLEESGATADMARAYNDIIEKRQRAGRTEIERRNYLTYAVEAQDKDAAAESLRAMTENVIGHYGRMDVRAEQLDGMARMRLMHDLVRGNHEPFLFTYDRVRNARGAAARDFIAPPWAIYPESERSLRRYFMTPGRVVKVFHIKDFGSDLSDRAIRSIRALPIPMNISLTFRPQPKGKIVQRVRQNIDVLQAAKLDYQQKVAKGGGDITTLPPAMERREADAVELMDYISDQDEQVCWFQGLICVYARNESEMAGFERLLMDERGAWTIDLVELPLDQEHAFTSSLPLATPLLTKKYRSLTTSERTAMVPFMSQNIHDDPMKSLMLGVDTVSGEHILVNPDRLKSPHMWLFGMTGAGKGMEVNAMLTYSMLQHPRTVRDEVTGRWVCPDPLAPQWFAFDFHAEYLELGRRLGASISTFGPGHAACLNPMDMSNSKGTLTIGDVRANIDFFLALTASVMERPLLKREQGLIDKILRQTYKGYIGTDERPTFFEFYSNLRKYGQDKDDALARELSESFELYAEGSMSAFAGRTNVLDDPQLNIYDFSELGETMQTLAILSALQHVRQATFSNYRIGRPTYLLFEEAQIIFDNDPAVRLLDSFFSELRKFGLHIICVTQLPNRVLNHKQAVNLFENTGLFVFLPNQQNNADKLTDMFHLSQSQADRIRQQAEPGTGLVLADGVKIAMQNRIDRDSLLYEIWNTDADKMARLDGRAAGAA